MSKRNIKFENLKEGDVFFFICSPYQKISKHMGIQLFPIKGVCKKKFKPGDLVDRPRTIKVTSFGGAKLELSYR